MSVFQRNHRGDVGAAVGDLLVATTESSDALIDSSVPEALRAIRDEFGMDVVFVSEFRDGQRVFRHVDGKAGAPALPVGGADPLESSFCQRVVDGRMPGLVHDVRALPPGTVPETPFPIGAHMSTPIVLEDGATYGTLCCFSQAAHPLLRESDMRMLRDGARLVARKIAEGRKRGKPPEEWALMPMDGTGVSKAWKLP